MTKYYSNIDNCDIISLDSVTIIVSLISKCHSTTDLSPISTAALQLNMVGQVLMLITRLTYSSYICMHGKLSPTTVIYS